MRDRFVISLCERFLCSINGRLGKVSVQIIKPEANLESVKFGSILGQGMFSVGIRIKVSNDRRD